MSDDRHTELRVKCPWCAEMIKPEALVCPFCRSDLAKNKPADSQGKAASSRPGMARAMFLNLLCPGLGAWKLGYRMRGLVFCVIIIACLLVYAGEIVPEIQQEVTKAMRTGRTNNLMKLEADLKNNQWLDAAFYLYIASFIDTYFLISNADRNKKSGGGE